MTLTSVVCIGRNVGSRPMHDLDWGQFQADLLTIVLEAGGTVHAFAEGTGEWDGVTETCVLVVFAGAETIQLQLAGLARRYRQDAIALVQAETELLAVNDDTAAS